MAREAVDVKTEAAALRFRRRAKGYRNADESGAIAGAKSSQRTRSRGSHAKSNNLRFQCSFQRLILSAAMKSKLMGLVLPLSSLFWMGSPSGAAEPPPGRSDSSEAFFSNGIIPRLRIELDAAAQSSLRQDSRRYVKATVTDSNTVYRDVGLHLKGGNSSFRQLDSTPCLTLNFNKFVKGQKFHGLDKLHLNNSVQDQTYLNELIGGELFRQAGIPAPRVTHARVQLNGRDLGLYVLVEGFDKTFLRRHFADPHGNLYDGGEATDIFDPLKKTSGNGPNDRSDLKALADALKAPDPPPLPLPLLHASGGDWSLDILGWRGGAKRQGFGQAAAVPTMVG